MKEGNLYNDYAVIVITRSGVKNFVNKKGRVVSCFADSSISCGQNYDACNSVVFDLTAKDREKQSDGQVRYEVTDQTKID